MLASALKSIGARLQGPKSGKRIELSSPPKHQVTLHNMLARTRSASAADSCPWGSAVQNVCSSGGLIHAAAWSETMPGCRCSCCCCCKQRLQMDSIHAHTKRPSKMVGLPGTARPAAPTVSGSTMQGHKRGLQDMARALRAAHLTSAAPRTLALPLSLQPACSEPC